MIMKETKNPWNHSIHLPQSFLFVSAGKTNAIAVVGDAGRKANDKETRQVTGCNTRGKQALSITGRSTTGKQTLNMGETQQVHKLSSLPADARSYTTALSTDNLRNVRCYASFSRLLQKEDNLRWVFIPSFFFFLPSRCLFQQNSRVQAWSCFILFFSFRPSHLSANNFVYTSPLYSQVIFSKSEALGCPELCQDFANSKHREMRVKKCSVGVMTSSRRDTFLSPFVCIEG